MAVERALRVWLLPFCVAVQCGNPACFKPLMHGGSHVRHPSRIPLREALADLRVDAELKCDPSSQTRVVAPFHVELVLHPHSALNLGCMRAFDVAIDDSILASMAGRYAGALFELAKEGGQLSQVENDLGVFQNLLDESADLRRLVVSPVFSAEDQEKAVGALLDKSGIGGITGNFLKFIAGNRRLMAVGDMIDAFRKLAADDRGEVTAEVVSASALSQAQVASLKSALNAKTGQEVLLDMKVDPDLLGGLVVKIGSQMVDSSLRTKLSTLRVNMTGAS